jgi:signal transduction histidine kinase/DNA-binding response OmpR family regulator
MRLLIIIISIFVSICRADSQPFIPVENALHFTHYRVSDGLPHSTVRTLIQDEQGLLWIGTRQGIALFDGQTMTLLDKDAKSPLASVTVFGFALGKDSSMWIATYQHGLFHYFPKTKSWKQYGVNGDKDGLASPVIRTVFVDDAGIVWAGTRLGLHRFDSSSDKFEQILDLRVGTELLPNYVTTITSADSEHLWLGTGQGLVYFNKKNSTFKRFLHIKDDITSLPNNAIRDLWRADDDLLWVATDRGITSIAANSTSFNNHPPALDGIANQCQYPLNSLMVDSKKRMWVGTYQKGLCIGAVKDRQFSNFNRKENIKSLRSNNINDVIEDRAGNIWLATHQGLSKYEIERNGIESISMGLTIGTSQIHSLYVEDNKALLSFPNGSILVDSEQLNTLKETSIKANEKIITLSTYVPGKGIYAIRDGDSRLYRLDEKSLEYLPTSISFLTTENDNFVQNSGTTLYPYESGFLGVLWQKKGYLIDLNLSTIKPIYGKMIEKEQPSIYFHKVGNDLWGCGIKGDFHSHNLETGKENIVSFGDIKKETISCVSLYLGNSGLWVISDEKVYLFNTKSKKLIYTAEVKGASSLSEVGDYLWIITQKNIVRIDLKNQERFVIELDEFGTASQNMAAGNYFDERNNRLYFPTMDNLIRLNLDVVSQPFEQLGVNFREFRLFNKVVDIGKDKTVQADSSIAYANSIKLDHTQYMFQLDFATDSFTNVDEMFFRYRLDGFNSDWIETNSENPFALYSGVTDGRYEFQVQATRDKEHWPIKSKQLEIIILPPWWSTWWIYLLYACTFLLITYVFVDQLFKRKMAEKDKLNALDIAAAKQNVFANISHEFRTPLTLILGPSAAIKKKTAEKKTKYAIELIERNANRLLSMVDQILDLARLQGEQQQERKVQDVAAIIEFLVHSFQSLVEEKKIELSIDNMANDELYVSMVPDAFTKIMTNLLSNAFKYTSSGGAVTIRIEIESNNVVVVSVKDSGCGMSQDELAFIFERFTRLENTEDSSSGFGIGLALVKQLVDSHGGTIMVTSELNLGSTFTVKLPRIQNQSELSTPLNTTQNQYVHETIAKLQIDNAIEFESVTSDEGSDALGKPSILIIEDNVDMQRYLKDTLTSQYQCVIAPDGKEGVRLAIEQVPDFIISDLMMPKMNGFEVANVLKSNEITSHIPIILLTAKGDRDSRLRGWKENVDDYLTKPFDADELLIRVANLLSIRALLRQRFTFELHNNEQITLSKFSDSDKSDSDLASAEQKFIERFNQYLTEHIRETNLRIEGIAQALHMTERQLLRKIRALTNSSPSDYLRSYRLDEASRLLEAGKTSGEAAYLVGFSSHSYFARCFKAKFNITPSDFIANNTNS